ncbi:hypothetical protein, partial [Citrobacter werkmanii]|uniref:hypothetical protein n=1 Tax=Citrobacter werkmanii TaxID=67827 RepID=UPI001A921349
QRFLQPLRIPTKLILSLNLWLDRITAKMAVYRQMIVGDPDEMLVIDKAACHCQPDKKAAQKTTYAHRSLKSSQRPAVG